MAAPTVNRMASISEDMLRELGQVAVAASALEFQTAEVAHVLLDENLDVGLAVTAGMSFTPLLGLVDRLALVRLDPHERASRLFTAAKPYAERAMERRNDLLHGYWAAGAGLIINSKTKEPLRRTEGIDLAHLRSVSDALHTAAALLWEVYYRSARELGYGEVSGRRWSWPGYQPTEQYDFRLEARRKARPPAPPLVVHPVEEGLDGQRSVGYSVDI